MFEGQTYYLFRQDYRKGVQEYFKKGVLMNDALNYSKAHRDFAIERTMEKLPSHIRYIEKEYGVELLEQTKKQNSKRRGHNDTACA